MCFQRKSQKYVVVFFFCGKMQEISALKANTSSFGQILVTYLPFPHQALV